MTSLPHLSVVLPIYNGSKYLREAVKSVLNQTYGEFELIAINDGSTDDSLEILHSFNDSRLRIFTQQNQGLIATLRRGVELARSPLVARMDQDDICLPHRFTTQVNFMNEHPEVGVCGGAVLLSENNKQRVVTFPTSDAEIRWHFCFNSPIVHPTVVFRKTIAQQVDGYRQKSGIELVEDYDLWTRLAPVTKFANLTEPLLMLRKHNENMTVTSAGKHIQQSQGVSQRYIQSLLRHPISIDDVRTLRNENPEIGNIFTTAVLLKEIQKKFCTKILFSNIESKSIEKDYKYRLTKLGSRAFQKQPIMSMWDRTKQVITTGLVFYFLRHQLILGVQSLQRRVENPPHTPHG